MVLAAAGVAASAVRLSSAETLASAGETFRRVAASTVEKARMTARETIACELVVRATAAGEIVVRMSAPEEMEASVGLG